jgi:lysophospholipase L1-like esterase
MRSHFLPLLTMLLASSTLIACLRSAPRAEAMLAVPPIVERLRAAPTGEWWNKKVAEFRLQNVQVPAGGIVFCGDSITAGMATAAAFAKPSSINRGIGGDGLAGLLQRLDVSAVDLQPRKLFLMIGINDIVFTSYTLTDYRVIYDYLLTDLKARCHGCTFYVQSILPMRGKYASHNPMVLQVNRELEALAAKHGMIYVNLHPHFCAADGMMRTDFSVDGVHPNAAGYEAWRSVIEPYLAEAPKH